jgi:subtilisin family serine protease
MMINPNLPQAGAVYQAKKTDGAKSAAAAGEAAQAAAPSDSSQVTFAKGGVNVAALLSSTAEAAAGIADSLPDHVPGEVIVKLKPDFAFSTKDTNGLLGGFAQDYGAEVSHRFDIPENMFKSFNGEMIVVKLPAGMSTAQGMAAMAQDPRVAFAASNDIVQAGPVEVNEDAAQVEAKPEKLNPALYGLHNDGQTGGTADADIDAPEAWGIQVGKNQAENGPLIAVVDTGINYNHEALKGNIWVNPGEIPGDGIDNDNNGVIDDVHGYNAAAKNGNPLDDNDHGTHCAGTIGANGDNSKGLYGVMHKANIMGVKFLTASGGGTLQGAIDSVLYASKMGARIQSHSWGGGGFNQALYDAFKASPSMHVVAAGNERNNNDARPAYPATFDLPNVISVAATDHKDNMASFTNWGATTVDLSAPGVNILSATSGSATEYQSFSGTSMACPHVSGVAGLLVSEFPEIGNEELKARLLETVDKKPQLDGKMVTGGRVNAHAALQPRSEE